MSIGGRPKKERFLFKKVRLPKKDMCLICNGAKFSGVLVSYSTWNETLFYCSGCVSRLTKTSTA